MHEQYPISSIHDDEADKFTSIKNLSGKKFPSCLDHQGKLGNLISSELGYHSNDKFLTSPHILFFLVMKTWV